MIAVVVLAASAVAQNAPPGPYNLATLAGDVLETNGSVLSGRAELSRGPNLAADLSGDNLYGGVWYPGADPLRYIQLKFDTTGYWHIHVSFIPHRDLFVGPCTLHVILSTNGEDGPFSLIASQNVDPAVLLIPGDQFSPVNVNLGIDAATAAANNNSSVVIRVFAWNAGMLDIGSGRMGIANVVVNAGVRAPVAVDDTYETIEDELLIVTPHGLLANDIIPETAPGLFLSAWAGLQFAAPHADQLQVMQNGGFLYKGQPNFYGVDTFKYRIMRNSSLLVNSWIGWPDFEFSNDALVTINVLPVYDPAEPLDDHFSTGENLPLYVAPPGVAGNDDRMDSTGPLTAFVLESTMHGLLVLNADGSFTYTPDADYSGPDQFTYYLMDGDTGTSSATAFITVGPINDKPVAVPEKYTTAEDTPLVVAVADSVLNNDTDADDDVLSAVLVHQAQHGIVVLNSNGSFTYTPFPQFSGEDCFSYQAFDGLDDSNVVYVKINVEPVDDPPVPLPDLYATQEGVPITVVAPGVLGNDTDIDDDTLTALLQANPAHGTVVLNGDGSFTYTPAPQFEGADQFTYQAFDGTNFSVPVPVVIIVSPRNILPVALDDEFSTPKDTPLTVPAPGVLQNDTDADHDAMTAVLVAGPLRGTLVLQADGSFTYTPIAGFVGHDSFRYFATDGLGFSETVTVAIHVTPVNIPPQLLNIVVNNINENGSAVLSGFVTDPDPDDSAKVTVNWGDGSAPMVLELALGETFFTFTKQFLDDNPSLTPADLYAVQVTATDDHGGSASASVPLLVSNITPSLFNVTMTSPLSVGQQGTLSGIISDPGTQDTFQLQVDWNDGSPFETIFYPAGTTSFQLKHTYAAAGAYNVTLILTDDDAGATAQIIGVIVKASCDLELVKTVTPNPANIGEDVVFTLVVKNNGPDTATNVKVLEFMPANVTVLESTPGYVLVDGVMVFDMGTMLAGTSKMISIKVHPTQSGPVENMATAICDQEDPTPANASGMVIAEVKPIDGADLTGQFVVVGVPTKKLYRGGNFRYIIPGEFMVSNRGNKSTNVSMTRLYLSDDDEWSPNDKFLWGQRTRGLRGLYSNKMGFQALLPYNWLPSGKFLICRVDDADVVLEVNETNNVLVFGPLP